MQYPLANKYSQEFLQANIMGPNPLKLLEELFSLHRPQAGELVLDLGCGRGVTSIFMAREYGLRVFATDLWIPATENKQRFDEFALTAEQIVPIHADAHELPYADNFFDSIVSVDSYHYFGLDKEYLGKYLLPLLKPQGYLLIVVPGFKEDYHQNLPAELLLSWTPQDLETMQDTNVWRHTLEATPGLRIAKIIEMESMQECWDDWLACDNEYSVGDRKTMNAGGGKYLNFIAIIAQKL